MQGNHFGGIRLFAHDIRGLSLIELLTVLSIGIILAGILFASYSKVLEAESILASDLRSQQNLEKAAYILESAIGRAGQVGCINMNIHPPVYNPTPYSFTQDDFLQIAENQLTVRYARLLGSLKEPMQDLTHLSIISDRFVKVGEILVVADCTSVDLFQVNSVTRKGPLLQISTSPLHKLYKEGAELGSLVIDQYFIANTKQYTVDNRRRPALFREDKRKHRFKLVQDIREFRMETTHTTGIHLRISMDASPLPKILYVFAPYAAR